MARKRSASTADSPIMTKAGRADAAAPATPSSTRSAASTDMAVTSIHLPRELLKLLRMASINRADIRGGRPSVSDVIRDVLERHRDEIEDETGL